MSKSAHSSKPPFLAFASDAGDIEALKAFADSQQWPDSCILQGDIRTASEFLKAHTSPELLLVEIPSAEEAAGLLDGLAEVCDPDTKVIVIGKVNEYSFYCWLMDLGISSYLLKPLNAEMLEGAYQKSLDKPQAAAGQGKSPAKLIAVMGTRGGVGASTVSINLAGVLADAARKQVALVDLDPQEGSIALTLDIEPSRGFREVLEKPDRIDSLFIERVMNKPHKNLSVLSAEETLNDRVTVHEHAAEMLLKEIRAKFDVVVMDVPRYLNQFSRQCLMQADHVVLVTDLTLLALRDALRLADLMRESLKMKMPMVVANRVGLAPKFEMRPADFEKGINSKIAHSITFSPDMFMEISTDIAAIKHKTNSVVAPIYQLAAELMPEVKIKAPGAVAEKKKFSLFESLETLVPKKEKKEG
jgi:pilus assembly protein CpaE